jgi:hypothetical protein
MRSIEFVSESPEQSHAYMEWMEEFRQDYKGQNTPYMKNLLMHVLPKFQILVQDAIEDEKKRTTPNTSDINFNSRMLKEIAFVLDKVKNGDLSWV